MPPNREATYKTSFHGIAQGSATSVRQLWPAAMAPRHLPSSDPKSMVNPKNLGETCGNCHSGPSRFLALGKIHQSQTLKDNPLVFLIKLSYIILIVGTVGGFIIYIILDLFSHYARRLFAGCRAKAQNQAQTGGEGLPSLPGELPDQHIIMMLSFSTLDLHRASHPVPESGFLQRHLQHARQLPVARPHPPWRADRAHHFDIVHTVFVLSSRRARKDPGRDDAEDQGLQRSQESSSLSFRSLERAAGLREIQLHREVRVSGRGSGFIIMSVTGFLLWFPGWTMAPHAQARH